MLSRFAGNSALYILASLLNRGVAFLLLPILTRQLTPADYGVMSVCTSTSMILSMLTPLSLTAAITIFYFQLDEDRFRALLRTLWLWLLIVPLAMTLLLDWSGPWLEMRYLPSIPWHPYMRIAVWTAYFSISPLVILALLRAEGKAVGFSVVTVLSFLLMTTLQIYLIVFRHEGALGGLRAQLIAGVLTAVATHAMVLGRIRGWSWPWLEIPHLEASLRFCLPYIPHVGCMWVLNASDRLILGRFVPLSAIGIYNLAYTLGMMVHLVGTGITTAYAPMYYERSTEAGFRSRLPALLGGSLLINTWVCLAVSLLAPEVIHVMTRPAYYGAAVLVPWVAAGYWCFVAIYQPCLAVLEGKKRTSLIILLTGPPAILNVGLNWLFVPHYGILAAAVNTLLTFIFMCSLAWVVSRRLDPLPFPWLSLAQMLAISLSVALVGVRWLSAPSLWTALCVKGILLGIALILMGQTVGLNGRALRAFRARRAITKPVPT